MVDTDDLGENSLFKYLESGNALDQAAKKSYLVVIPVNDSLSSIHINRDIALSHILASTNKNNVYYTLNKQMVVLKDNQLETVKSPGGFLETRVVSILTQEQFYTESFDSFTLVRTDFPLCGRICPKYISRVKAQNICATSCQERSIEENVMVMRIVLGTEGIRELLHQLSLFAKDIIQRYVMAKNLDSQINLKFQSTAGRCLQHTIQLLIDNPISFPSPTSTLHKDITSSSPFSFNVKQYRDDFWTMNVWRQVQVGCSSVLFSQLQNHILSRLQSTYQTDDERAAFEVNRLRNLLVSHGVSLPSFNSSRSPPSHRVLSSSPSHSQTPHLTHDHNLSADITNSEFFTHIALREPLCVDLSTYITPLLNIYSIQTALSMLSMIESVLSSVVASIQRLHPSETVAAEEMIALTVYVLVAANVQHLKSLSIFLKHYRLSSNTTGYEGNGVGLPEDPYVVLDMGKIENVSSSVEAAIDFIIQNSPLLTSSLSSPLNTMLSRHNSSVLSVDEDTATLDCSYSGYGAFSGLNSHSGRTSVATSVRARESSGGDGVNSYLYAGTHDRLSGSRYNTYAQDNHSNSLSNFSTNTNLNNNKINYNDIPSINTYDSDFGSKMLPISSRNISQGNNPVIPRSTEGENSGLSGRRDKSLGNRRYHTISTRSRDQPSSSSVSRSTQFGEDGEEDLSDLFNSKFMVSMVNEVNETNRKQEKKIGGFLSNLINERE